MEVGRSIARALVQSKLAACVNILPGVESIYMWKGEVDTSAELLMMIKTRAELVKELTQTVKSMHPYEVCEVIATPITGGNEPYLQWIRDETKDASSSSSWS
jgi:periplasmic divalent cation tolerance protein